MFLDLDLASICSGWCAGNGASMPEVGVWNFPQFGDDYGWMIDVLHGHVVAGIERFRPTEVGYESPIWKPGDKLPKMRRLYSLGPHVEWVCRTKGVECGEISLHDMKAEMTGDRNADKDLIVAACERLGVPLPKSQGRKDAADAFAAHMVHLRLSNSPHYPRWASAIWRNRGDLL